MMDIAGATRHSCDIIDDYFRIIFDQDVTISFYQDISKSISGDLAFTDQIKEVISTNMGDQAKHTQKPPLTINTKEYIIDILKNIETECELKPYHSMRITAILNYIVRVLYRNSENEIDKVPFENLSYAINPRALKNVPITLFHILARTILMSIDSGLLSSFPIPKESLLTLTSELGPTWLMSKQASFVLKFVTTNPFESLCINKNETTVSIRNTVKSFRNIDIDVINNFSYPNKQDFKTLQQYFLILCCYNNDTQVLTTEKGSRFYQKPCKVIYNRGKNSYSITQKVISLNKEKRFGTNENLLLPSDNLITDIWTQEHSAVLFASILARESELQRLSPPRKHNFLSNCWSLLKQIDRRNWSKNSIYKIMLLKAFSMHCLSGKEKIIGNDSIPIQKKVPKIVLCKNNYRKKINPRISFHLSKWTELLN